MSRPRCIYCTTGITAHCNWAAEHTTDDAIYLERIQSTKYVITVRQGYDQTHVLRKSTAQNSALSTFLSYYERLLFVLVCVRRLAVHFNSYASTNQQRIFKDLTPTLLFGKHWLYQVVHAVFIGLNILLFKNFVPTDVAVIIRFKCHTLYRKCSCRSLQFS